MLSFKLVYSEHYALPIGRHIFPAGKYRGVRHALLAQRLAEESDFVEPSPATESDILLAHSPLYVNKLMEGSLTAREELQLEIPYSLDVLRSFFWHTGGSILAAEQALRDGIGFNLGGGFHHAFPDHGEGFCMVHDVAVAIRKVQQSHHLERVMVVDCDVHHGNGTAAVFCNAGDSSNPQDLDYTWPGATVSRGHFDDVFALSLHQQNNYPLWKPPSSLDVNLHDGVGDAEYLACLEKALQLAFQAFEPQLVCYIAGADPFAGDQLGGLNLTLDGLIQRDQLVLRAARDRGIPVMITFAGGYARRLDDTIAIHCNTVQVAREVLAASAPGAD